MCVLDARLMYDMFSHALGVIKDKMRLIGFSMRTLRSNAVTIEVFCV